MLKKYFEWTPSDIRKWEELRAKGLPRFILWFGIQLFAGWLFLIIALATLGLWLLAALQKQPAPLAVLLLQLLLGAAACLVGGLVAALGTWALEEGIYRRIISKQETGNK